MIVAKWGGSLLTNKTQGGAPRIRTGVARRLADEWKEGLRAAGSGSVLVHGAGSFGHPLVLRHRVGRRRIMGPERERLFGRIRSRVAEVQALVVRALGAAGVESVAVPASMLAHSEGGRVRFDASVVASLAKTGACLVTGGDVVLDDRLGLRVLSGDEIVVHLSRHLRPRRAVFATDVDGLQMDGRVLLELPPPATRAALRRLRPGTDATGGMRGKVEAAAHIQAARVEAWIVNGARPGVFRQAIAGGHPRGTRFPPARPVRPKRST